MTKSGCELKLVDLSVCIFLLFPSLSFFKRNEKLNWNVSLGTKLERQYSVKSESMNPTCPSLKNLNQELDRLGTRMGAPFSTVKPQLRALTV